MPSKLRKAIGAVKDQTSISLAKVAKKNAANLEVAVLKATTHEEVPVDDRYVNEILLLTSSNKLYAAACAQAIAKRIGRTRNWIVALKALMIVLRLFQDGDPYFPREVLHAMKRGAKIVNLSGFRDDYNSSPWDYTAFVRTFALYLNERLDCFLTGKLQRRMVMRERDRDSQPRRNRFNDHVRDMKPTLLLDKISHWQRLLDRAIGTRPTGAAKMNRLVQIVLYCIVRETFDLYRDISDGLALILDSFFHLQYQSCVDAYQTCIKASKQFAELSKFYAMCKDIGVGRSSEYPSVQTISDELTDTLQEFLKDQSSFPSRPGYSPQRPPLHLNPLPTGTSPRGSSEPGETSEQQIECEGRDSTEFSSDLYHERAISLISLEDLISVTDIGTSPSYSIVSFEQDRSVEQLQFSRHSTMEEDFFSCVNSAGTSPSVLDKASPLHDFASVPATSPNPSLTNEQRNNSAPELTMLDEQAPPQEEQQQQQQQQQPEQQEPSVSNSDDAKDGWELVLAESANRLSSTPETIGALVALETSFQDQFKLNESTATDDSNYKNPFLTDDAFELPTPPTPTLATPTLGTPTLAITTAPTADDFSAFPTFEATPTFSAQNPNNTTPTSAVHLESDPFADFPPSQGSTNQNQNQNHLLLQQQLWLENQSKIIAKHIV